MDTKTTESISQYLMRIRYYLDLTYLPMKYIFIKIGEKQFCNGKPRRCHLNQMININMKSDERDATKCSENNTSLDM